MSHKCDFIEWSFPSRTASTAPNQYKGIGKCALHEPFFCSLKQARSEKRKTSPQHLQLCFAKWWISNKRAKVIYPKSSFCLLFVLRFGGGHVTNMCGARIQFPLLVLNDEKKEASEKKSETRIHATIRQKCFLTNFNSIFSRNPAAIHVWGGLVFIPSDFFFAAFSHNGILWILPCFSRLLIYFRDFPEPKTAFASFVIFCSSAFFFFTAKAHKKWSENRSKTKRSKSHSR